MNRLFGPLAALALSGLAAGPSLAAPRPMKKTAPDPVHFTFVAYGDTRSHPDKHRLVIAEIVRLHPEFVLQSGDLVANGKDPAQWQEFAQITRPLRDAHIAYYPARGNHDVGPYYPKFVTQPFDSGNTLYYAFTRHRCRFLMVDSMQDYTPGSAQYQWLEAELKKAQRTAVNTFVVFHEAPFSVGPHGPTPEARQYLHPLFVKYHPRAVFCGHDHLYYRTIRDGVVYFVTGGGGAPPYRPQNADVAIPGDVYQRDTDSSGRPISDAEYDAKTYHAIRCEVNGPRVTFTAIRPDGSVIDRIVIGAR